MANLQEQNHPVFPGSFEVYRFNFSPKRVELVNPLNHKDDLMLYEDEWFDKFVLPSDVWYELRLNEKNTSFHYYFMEMTNLLSVPSQLTSHSRTCSDNKLNRLSYSTFDS